MVKTPRSARTCDQIWTLPRDNVSCGDYWFIVDENTVSMSEQKMGQLPKGSVTVPRHVFERFLDWYNTGSMQTAK